MSVWKSDDKLLLFAPLISSKIILAENYIKMKHLEVRQEYSAARLVFSSLLRLSSGDETLRLMLDILHQASKY